MKTPSTLGILVLSDRYFEYVLALTQAAVAKGKTVRICLLGPGTAMIHSDLPRRLADDARIFVCGAGSGDFRWMLPSVRPTRIDVVSAGKLMEILYGCERHVSF